MAKTPGIRNGRMKICKLASILTGAAALMMGLATPASAHSAGAYPTELLFSNTLRNGSYQQTIGIIDDSPTPDTYQLTVTGNMASWVTFRAADNPAAVITTAQAQAGPPTQVIVEVDVPSQAADGTYQGVVHLTPNPVGAPAGTKDGQGVGISADIPIGIKVSGTQTISGALLDAYTYPAIEVGSPLRLFTVLLNTGNVEVHPTITVTVARSGATMFSQIFNRDPVDPGLGPKTIESDWTDTTAAPVGRYLAHVDVKYLNTEIGSRDVPFSVVPYGSLRRAGNLDALRLENRPAPGRAAVVKAVVHNVGQIETRPVFHGELYLDGKLLKGVTSVPVLTLPGQTATIDMVVNLPSGGRYTLKGQANFDGTESNSRSLSFRVGAAPGSPILFWLLGGFVFVSGGAGWAWRKRRRRGRGPDGEGGPRAAPLARPRAEGRVAVLSSQGEAFRLRPWGHLVTKPTERPGPTGSTPGSR